MSSSLVVVVPVDAQAGTGALAGGDIRPKLGRHIAGMLLGECWDGRGRGGL